MGEGELEVNGMEGGRRGGVNACDLICDMGGAGTTKSMVQPSGSVQFE